jgi:hypothetical protein
VNRMSFGVSLAISILLSLPLSLAQQSSQTAAGIIVPRLIQFSGAINDAPGQPRSGVTGITFALYKDQAGGAALWLETQNVSLDAQGRYTVLLGANSAEGMPLELFAANGARWLGVQPEGQAEQRVLLVSVPYALKAADAETVGGMPASSFVLAAPAVNSGSGSSGSQTAGSGANSASASSTVAGAIPQAACATPPCNVVTSGGTANFLPLFADPTTVQNSVMSQGPCPFDATQTCVGITNTNPPLSLFTPTTSPTRVLDVNGEIRVGGGNIFMQRDLSDLPGRRNWAWGTETFNVGDVSLFVSASNTALPSLPVFTALSNGWMGIGVSTPHANLEIAGSAGGGLLVDSPGVITGSGAGLTSVPAASLTGTLPSAALAGVDGSLLINVNAAKLGGNFPSAFASTGSNTFTGDQSVTGSVSLTGSLTLPNTTSASVGVITLGSTTFLHNFGTNNTFVGASAGNLTMTSPGNNTAMGATALTANTTGKGQSAFGNAALAATTTGTQNSAFGASALTANTTGMQNAAFGNSALFANTSGNTNSAFGTGALEANTTANLNAAFGFEALAASTSGANNSAFGEGALFNLKTGSGNLALGAQAGLNLTGAESNNIYLGNSGVAGESQTARIGTDLTAVFITGISGRTSASGVAVFINTAGLLGTLTSSRRFKHEIADMGAESDLLMKLRPVAFYYKPEVDETQTRQYGLVAEEVAKVAPQLVVYDKDGAPQTVRYHFVNAMLLGAVQKQQRQIEQQARGMERQQSTIAQQQEEIQDLAARLAKLEALLAAQR